MRFKKLHFCDGLNCILYRYLKLDDLVGGQVSLYFDRRFNICNAFALR